ncbi:hypothetical protein [Vibrio harveyi]|uniref:hypothetical protein n=1 Tax=Vibrio harveyi TaxID=669 RepID=UPI003CF7EE60
MKKLGSVAVLLLLLSGCTNYHIEQNSKNGMTSTSCAERSAKGNLTLKKDCEIHVEQAKK